MKKKEKRLHGSYYYAPEVPSLWTKVLTAVSYPFRALAWKLWGKRRTIARMKMLAGTDAPIFNKKWSPAEILAEHRRLADHRLRLSVTPTSYDTSALAEHEHILKDTVKREEMPRPDYDDTGLNLRLGIIETPPTDN